jgi:2-oxoisovalerate dehydrogenase E1 component beta subunit
VIGAPWPAPEHAGKGVQANEPARTRFELLDPARRKPPAASALSVEPAPPFDPKGKTFLEAVSLGVRDALAADARVFVYGQDVGGKYGNAFLLLKPLLAEFGDRIINSPLAEGAVLGVCVGAALAGQRPIGVMQFNDFVATGFNQLVNNAAKIRYRWGGSVPMVVRMPWGGLRHAGPFHSQNTEAWFYRTPGLKIVAPSTPHDARALMAAAVADPDPVLYYEHIALYRDPRIKQALPPEPPSPIPLGRAALRRAGNNMCIVTYGAYVHLAMRLPRSPRDRIEAAVRSAQPALDRDASSPRRSADASSLFFWTRARGTKSLAAVIGEEASGISTPGASLLLDTPVPYSPPLEAAVSSVGRGGRQAARKLLTTDRGSVTARRRLRRHDEVPATFFRRETPPLLLIQHAGMRSLPSERRCLADDGEVIMRPLAARAAAFSAIWFASSGLLWLDAAAGPGEADTATGSGDPGWPRVIQGDGVS